MAKDGGVKPHIDDVSALFHEFQHGMSQALRLPAFSQAQRAAMNVHSGKLKVGLSELGLAKYIDWTAKT